MKLVGDMIRDWEKQEEPYREEEIKIFFGSHWNKDFEK